MLSLLSRRLCYPAHLPHSLVRPPTLCANVQAEPLAHCLPHPPRWRPKLPPMPQIAQASHGASYGKGRYLTSAGGRPAYCVHKVRALDLPPCIS